MIPAGILGSARVAPSAPTISFLSAGGAASGKTITGVNLGSAGSLLHLVLFVRTDGSPSGLEITAVTVGGVAATIDAIVDPFAANGNAFAFCRVTSPGGTGDVVMTTAGTGYRCAAGVWVAGSPVTYSSSANGNLSASLTCPSGGFVLAADYTHETTAPTLTGVSADFDTLAGTYHYAGGKSTSVGSVTVSTSATSTVGRLAAVAYA